MQHRFLPIFFNFVTIGLALTALCGCSPAENPLPPAETAAPTAVLQPQHTATPEPVDPLAAVTADTPLAQHPYYHQPVPAMRKDALPPLTRPPAAAERGTDTVHTDGNYDYIRYDDGTAGLIGCHFDVPTHVFDLPETVDGLPVTGLEPALAHSFEPATMHAPRNDIIIRIPKTVRYLGFTAAEAETMLDITIEFSPENPYFQTVGNSVFSADGTLLHSHHSDPADMHPQVYTVPDTVTHIGTNAFFHMQELIAVKLPAGLLHIGAHAFDGCENLSAILLPPTVETVGEDAFACFALTLAVEGRDTDLGTAPDIDAIARICSDRAAAAAAYAKAHGIAHTETMPEEPRIAIDPSTRHLFSYTLLADGTAKILRIHSDSRKEFTLPETADGIPVTAIGYETLLYINEKHEEYPKRIRVPACISKIDAGALWPETILGQAGSEAERFAAEEGIDFLAE